MCDPLTIIAGVGVGMSAGSSIMGGISGARANKKAAMYEAEMSGRNQAIAQINAQNIRLNGEEEARRIREQAINARATTIAAQASSGVVIGDGSAQAVVDEITRLSEQDVIVTLREAGQRAIATEVSGAMAAEEGRYKAGSYASAANAAMMQGVMSGAGSLLSGATGMMKGMGSSPGAGKGSLIDQFGANSSGRIVRDIRMG